MHNRQSMDNLDLNEQYRKINKEIFSNKLPENIPVKWNHSKTAMGKTRIRIPRNGLPEMSIAISRFFICSSKEYTETLIHEMIHVFMVENGEYHKDNRIHGSLFRKYMDQINKDFPQYTISVKENKQIPVDPSKIKKRHGYLILFNGKQYFNLYNNNIDEKMRKRIIRSLKRGFNIGNGKIYFFYGKYEEIASAPVRRTFKTLTGKIQYLRDSESMESLIEKIKKDSPHYYCIS